MKRIISILLAVCIMAACVPAAVASFPDVTDEATALAVNVLEGMGVVSGFEDGSYRPGEPLTRAQFCKLVVVLMGLESKTESAARSSVFSDVKSGSWYAGYVNLAAGKGLVNGKGNGLFAPDDSISYGEAVTILIRMLGYTSAQVGSVWPRDYVNFAADLGMDDGISCGMNEKIGRGEAALLLYNMLRAETASGKDYYATLGLEVSENVLLMSNSARSAGGSGDCAQVYLIDKGEVKTYPQEQSFSSDLIGRVGTLLLDDEAAVGFLPDPGIENYVDVDIAAKTSSSVTGKDGETHKIPSSAKVVSGGEVYTWSQKWSGAASARLYYKRGEVYLVYIPSESSGEAVVASTASAYSEIIRKLGAVDAALYKNGAPADSSDLARYDVAYYDGLMNAVMVSDRRVTGFIESAYPNLSGAETITVCGQSYTLLDCARDSAANFSLGNKVTLLLTDDLKVAAVYSPSVVSADMVGIAASNGRSVSLPGGITVSGSSVAANTNTGSYGSVVNVSESSRGMLSLTGVGGMSSGVLNIDAGTLGSYELAPGAVFYEWAGSGYAEEISLADVIWTNIISKDYIDYFHINSAGKVDIVLFNALTGACYDYGFASFSTRDETNYLTIENGSANNFSGVGGASVNDGDGIGLAGRGDGRVGGVVKLTRAAGLSVDAFDSTELMVVKNSEIAISEDVQVYNANTESWDLSLEDAIAFAGSYTVYYDKTPATGGMVRIVVLEKQY